MRGEAAPEEVLQVISLAGGCDPSSCAAKSCLCRDQTSALSMSFRLIRRADLRKSKTGRPHRPYTSREIAMIIDLHVGGATINQIAESTGRSALSVWQKVRALRARGLLPPPKGFDREGRNRAALSFIRGFVRDHGYPPGYDLIARAIGVKHKSQVTKVVQALRSEGLLKSARSK